MPRSSVSPVVRPTKPADSATSSSTTPTPAPLDEPRGEWLAYGPPALVLDEAERKRQIRAILDRGMAEVRAGVGYDLDAVRRETDKLIASRRK